VSIPGDYSLTFANAADAVFGAQAGLTLLRTHGPSKCEGRPCCIHHPSPHRMREWELNIRFDRGIAERICPHGVGHPDPDDATYRRTLPGEYDDGIHGCDGCCWEKERRTADRLTALTGELGLYGETPTA
jgi:hypothetical protein